MRIGIDLGGTKIEGIALSENGKELARKRVSTPRGDYAGTVTEIANLVRSLEAETGEQGTVGIGIPGSISRRTGLIKNANSTWIIGKPFDKDLSEAMNRPVRLENDANCFAVSEAVDGAGAGAEVVFGVIIGTGCGGGIVVSGKPVGGLNSIAGEWGHNPLPWPRPEEMPGPACYCGKHNCIETWLSGPGFSRDHEAHTGETLTAIEISKRAAQGDQKALGSIERYADRLARGLASVINVLDPDVIVLGGGMSNVSQIYDLVPSKLSKWCFSDGVETVIRPPVHGDSSGVRGAAWLWRNAPEATTAKPVAMAV